MKKIPIKVAKEISKKYGYAQVVIMAISDNEKQDGWVATYNSDKSKCKLLGKVGSVLIKFIRGLYNFPETINKWEEYFKANGYS